MHPDVIAVFPLPNVVFFPHTTLPLHIFEPRYCQMVRETIENKQLIGMFLLRPGWQDDYYGNPPIFSVGCAGELDYVENLPDGKFNIVLRGVSRVRALETIQEYPYRKARIHILPDKLSVGQHTAKAIKLKLLKNFQLFTSFVNTSDLPSLTGASDLSEIANSVATALQLDLDEKRRILEEEDVFARATIVSDHLSNAVSVLKLTAGFNHLRPSDPNVN